MFVDHIATEGHVLYAEVCLRDLEGIVAKWVHLAVRSGGRALI